MSVPRSFIKGPRFFSKPSDIVAGGACERCVWNRGRHTCAEACAVCDGWGTIERTAIDDLTCSVCGGVGRVVSHRGPVDIRKQQAIGGAMSEPRPVK